MNFGKKGPYFLIVLLVIILIFILGVQYGKRVKIADTAIAYLLSITPSPRPKPSQIPVTEYTSYSHDRCKVSFLYPSYLKLERESTSEAKFSSQDKKQFVIVQCTTKLPDRLESTNSATITIDGLRAETFNDKNSKIIRIYRSSSPLEFTFNKELEPLITTSIEFE